MAELLTRRPAVPVAEPTASKRRQPQAAAPPVASIETAAPEARQLVRADLSMSLALASIVVFHVLLVLSVVRPLVETVAASSSGLWNPGP